MSASFGKALKNIAVELSLETPDTEKKKRGGRREAKVTPAKKARIEKVDTNASGDEPLVATKSNPSKVCEKIAGEDGGSPQSNFVASISRADLATRDRAESQDNASSLEDPKETPETSTAAAVEAASPETKPSAKGKAKAGRRKKKETDVMENAEGVASSPSEGSKRKKAKPEGPYTMFKEEGLIPEPVVERRTLPSGKASLKVIVWNVGGLRSFAKNRPEALPELVRQEQPDLLAILEHKMQEGAADTEETMNALLKALPDYETAALNCSTAKKGYSGTLIFMRKDAPKTISVKAIELSIARDEGRLLVAEFEPLTILLAYVPNSGDGLQRLDERIEKWDEELRLRLQELSSQKPIVLLGDLNVAHRDVDIWNVEAPHIPKSAGTTPRERDSFSKLLGAGFVDGFAHHHPDALGSFTYWSVRAGNRPKNRGLRLDYAVVSESLVTQSGEETSGPALVDVFHLPEMSKGDHCPVGALFAF